MSDRDAEKARHDEFLAKHEAFYGRLIEILCDCIGRDDVAELSLHITYIAKVIEQALRLRLIIQANEKRAGNT